MTNEKLESVFRFYRRWIDEDRNCEPKQHETDADHYEHLAWMCEQGEAWATAGEHIPKAMRWLGFVQGVLFRRNDFTLEDLRNHSRPDPEDA